MFPVSKRPFSNGLFFICSFGGTFIWGSDQKECSNSSPRWTFSFRAATNKSAVTTPLNKTMKKAHKKRPFLHEKHKEKKGIFLWLDKCVEQVFRANKKAQLVIPVRNKMEYKQLLKMIVAMCIVQLEGKESNNATWYLTYSLQQPAEKTTFEKHLISTQNWIWGILLTNIWASKIGWLSRGV